MKEKVTVGQCDNCYRHNQAVGKGYDVNDIWIWSECIDKVSCDYAIAGVIKENKNFN